MATLRFYCMSAPSIGLPLRKISGAQFISLATTSTAASTSLKPGNVMISAIADTPCSFSVSGSTGVLWSIPAADTYFDFEIPGGSALWASTSTA